MSLEPRFESQPFAKLSHPSSAELKDKLNQETDATRQLALRKELDAKSYQERLDRLVSPDSLRPAMLTADPNLSQTAEHSATRESLVSASTSKEHLEQRVAELTIQITAKEEKLAIYEGRGNRGADDPSRSIEEQLEVTVADLRAELRSTKAELERATVNVQQFKDIAEAEGGALAELTATYDAYKASTDTTIAEKEVSYDLIEKTRVLAEILSTPRARSPAFASASTLSRPTSPHPTLRTRSYTSRSKRSGSTLRRSARLSRTTCFLFVPPTRQPARLSLQLRTIFAGRLSWPRRPTRSTSAS